jgi:hypothetical protein
MSHKRIPVRNERNQDAKTRSLGAVDTGTENLTSNDAVRATHNDIARRAYDLYEQRGCITNQCRQNWLQAERELRNANQGDVRG